VLGDNLLILVGKQAQLSGAVTGLTGVIRDFADAIATTSKWLDENSRAVTGLTDAMVTAAKIAAGYFAIFVAAPAILLVVSGFLGGIARAVALMAYNMLFVTPKIVSFNSVLFGTSVSANLAAGGLTKMKLALYSVFAAFAGWQIGTLLSEQFQTVRLAGLTFVGLMMRGFQNMETAALMAGAAIASLLPWTESYTDAKARIMAAHDAEIAAIDENIVGLMAYELTSKSVAAEEEKAVAVKAAVVVATKEQLAAAKKLAEAQASFLGGLEKEVALLGLTTRQQKLYEAGKLKLTDAQMAQVKSNLAAIAAHEESITVMEAAKNATAALSDAEYTRVTAYEATLDSMADANQAIREETELLGLTREQQLAVTQVRQDSVIAIKQEQLARLQNSETMSREQIALEEEIRLLKERQGLTATRGTRNIAVEQAKAAGAEWKKTADDIERGLTDSLFRAFESGKGFFATLWDGIKNLFKTTILKLIISPVSGALTGALGMSGSANAGQSSGMDGLSSLSSMANSGMGWLTDFGGSVAGAASSIGSTIGGEAGANMIMNSEAIGATAQSLGTVLGYAQAAYAFSQGNYGEAAGRAAGTFFFGPIGGELGGKLGSLLDGGGKISARDTGDASLTTGAGGNMLALDSVNGLSAQTAGIAMGLQTSYVSAARALGITLAQTNFATGSNSGRQGANPNLAFASTVNGNSFQSGEISAADSAAVSLAAARAVFSALQSSTLPEYLAGAFDGITASTATQEQITAALAGAQALATFHAALTALPFERVASLSYEATQALIAYSGGLDALAANLGTYYTNFFSDEEQRAQKIININAATIGSGLDAATATRESFRALVEAQDLTTASGQQTYATLLSVSGAFAGITPAAVQATLAVDKISVAVIDMAQLAADALDAAKTAVSDTMAGLGRAVDAERNRITDAYQSQAASINASLMTVGSSISQLQSLSGTLKSTLDGMRISGSPASFRASAQADIAAALRQARSGGGLPLDGELDSALRTVAQPSEQLFSSFEAYAKDFYRTANDISALADLTTEALTADQIQQRQMRDQLVALERYHADDMARLDGIISAAQAQIDAVNGVNNSVLSVGAAIANLGAAITALASAQTSSGAAASVGGGGGQTSPIVGGSNTGIGDSGYSLVGNTLYFPGGGSHSVAGAGGAQTLMDTYGLTSGSNGSLVRTRAMGGYTPPGMTWVGEEGPELANFQSPSMIYTAAQSRALSSGGDNAEMVAELRALRTEVASLRSDASVHNRQIAVNTKQSADTLQKFDIVGLPLERNAA
jgi:hypothetical protein